MKGARPRQCLWSMHEVGHARGERKRAWKNASLTLFPAYPLPSSLLSSLCVLDDILFAEGFFSLLLRNVTGPCMHARAPLQVPYSLRTGRMRDTLWLDVCDLPVPSLVTPACV